MPIEKELRETEEERDVCPDCGDIFVTPLEGIGALGDKPNPLVVIKYGGHDEVIYKNFCWNCGWEEEVKVTFEVLDE